MTPKRWQQVKEILDTVAATPAARRQAKIKTLCRGDVELKRDVESFLEVDDDIDDFIEEPLWSIQGSPMGPTADPDAAQYIGPYRLGRLLGRGGMGAVHLASREGDYEQQVALKLVSWGMDSEEILARFYTERQILANLQHPGIARLLDGGTTEEGMPYFAMEYVDGEPIDTYCQEHRLSIRQRLVLFRKMCAAVHFAHQNLVVHRDLKPSNILVTEEGEPKLLDFGIAKLLQPELVSKSFATAPGQGPMTPDFASPEQILNAPITTACDVYALGVLLYRLLTGQSPYSLQGRGYAEIVDAICTVEPNRPSTVVRQDTATRARADLPDRVEARRLCRQLSGDLDAIVMKAMRKEPNRRYGSAFELSEDIGRHLTGLPVQALQGTWTYVAGKFMRRHKLGLGMIFLILVFAIVTTFQWREAVAAQAEAESQRIEAERERNKSENTLELLTGIITSVEPDKAKGEDVTVREALEKGLKDVYSADLDPETRSEVLGTIGSSYHKLGLWNEALKVRKEVVKIRQDHFQENDPALATALSNLAGTLSNLGKYEESVVVLRRALKIRHQLNQPKSDVYITLSNLAVVLTNQGDYEEAEKIHRQVLEIRIELFGPEAPSVARSLYGLGMVHFTRGQLSDAEQRLRRALDLSIESLGSEHTLVDKIIASLARVLNYQGQYEEALKLCERSLKLRRRLFANDSVTVATAQKNLAEVLIELNDLALAKTLLDQAIPIIQQSSSESTWLIADAENVLGALLIAKSQYPKAEPILLNSYRVIRDTKGPSTIYTQYALKRLRWLYEDWEKPEKALQYHPEGKPSTTPEP